MGEGAWLVAFLIVQRLAELALAQWNTARLRAAGGIEFGAAHYPLMVLLHALAGRLVATRPRPTRRSALVRGLHSAAGGPAVDDREPRSALDHPRDRVARREPGCARSLSLA